MRSCSEVFGLRGSVRSIPKPPIPGCGQRLDSQRHNHRSSLALLDDKSFNTILLEALISKLTIRIIYLVWPFFSTFALISLLAPYLRHSIDRSHRTRFNCSNFFGEGPLINYSTTYFALCNGLVKSSRQIYYKHTNSNSRPCRLSAEHKIIFPSPYDASGLYTACW